MGERYIQLVKLNAGLYQEGCPLLIVAGQLLKDTVRNIILVQVKYNDKKKISSLE